MAVFRFPYPISEALDPWREQLGESFDLVVALLSDRDRALEDAVGEGGHSHNGAGTSAVVLTHSADTGVAPAEASGLLSTAAGDGAKAEGDYSSAFGQSAVATDEEASALGSGAEAFGVRALALGSGAQADAVDSISVGTNSNASYDNSVAIGDTVSTSGTEQVNVGTKRAFLGAPNSAAADATLVNGQITFYLNQAANTLVVKAKYSDGTVKTGTVSLS